MSARNDRLLKKIMSSRNDWLLKNKIIDILITIGATIFGGAVRSKLVHDSDARKYYQVAQSASRYDDQTDHPELAGRWEVPNDIDAYACESDFERIMTALQAHFTVTEFFQRDPTDYFAHLNVDPGSLTHYKLSLSHKGLANKISLFMQENAELLSSDIQSHLLAAHKSAHSSRTIQVDLLVSTIKLEPPFGRLDFDINGLLYDMNGVRLCKELAIKNDPIASMDMINRLVQKAKDKQARFMMGDLDMNVMILYRIDKFKKKGYTLEGVAEEPVQNNTVAPEQNDTVAPEQNDTARLQELLVLLQVV